MLEIRTCVAPSGRFVYGLHKPRFQVENLRVADGVAGLGILDDGRPVDNRANFPPGIVTEPAADWLFEIANPFPFRGTTYILKSWADARAADPQSISIPAAPDVSFSKWMARHAAVGGRSTGLPAALADLPEPLQLAVAVSSTDPQDLVTLAHVSCAFVSDGPDGLPTGLRYERDPKGVFRPVIHQPALFEAVANNAFLPDGYKAVMVLRPGAQGRSEIVGEYRGRSGGGVYEYLRRNSYIPWGHYAANMADDSVRYRVGQLVDDDMTGMRHLYYQRTYLRLAAELGLPGPNPRQRLSEQQLESLRSEVVAALQTPEGRRRQRFSATLWGWNFGFDFSPSGYRLHASHQQIHQQYALIPDAVACHGDPTRPDEMLPSYCCGDLVAACTAAYRQQTDKAFFKTYIEAIRNNRRMDGRSDRDRRLVVYEDAAVMLFVPKAQTSQWELQLMALAPVGNVVEADAAVRRALDRSLLLAMQILEKMGATMITVFELAKRIGAADDDQRLLYTILPRLPHSPGAFSEAQLRWINGHYPEDFAAACRARIPG